MKRFLVSTMFVLFFAPSVFPQCATMREARQFTFNGNAESLGNNEYLLTKNQQSQCGSVWFSNYLNLDADFTIEFEIYLGTNDGGADGIAFVLQQSPQGVHATSTGGGLGYKGISPSFAVEFDTWQNSEYLDPYSDHLAFTKNGSIVHEGNQPAMPVSVSNLEDGKYHAVKIVWKTANRGMQVFFDGGATPKMQVNYDLKNLLFAGNSFVYWGLTGATGAACNEQKVKMKSMRFVEVLEVSGTVINASCGTAGSVQLNVSGGYPPYAFGWSNGQSAQNLNNVPAGNYSVNVVDACGNMGKANFTLTSQSLPLQMQCPYDMLLDNTPGKCATDNVLFNGPSIISSCPGSWVTQTAGYPSGSSFPMGTTINTYVLTAPDGSSTSCSFKVTVQ